MTVPNVPPAGIPGAQPATQQPTSSSQFPSGTPTLAGPGFDPNAVIQPGPGVPPMLVGRKVGEALNITAQLIRQRQQPVAQPNVQTPAQQSLQAAGVQTQPTTQPQFDGNALADVVRQVIQEETLPDRILRVAGEFGQKYAQYKELEPEVYEVMRQLPAEQQAQPAMWDYALKMVVGQRALEGKPITGGAQQPTAQQGSGLFNQAQVNLPPNAWAPAGQQLFTEPPSNASGSYGSQRTLTAEEANIASKLGLDPAKVIEFNSQYLWRK